MHQPKLTPLADKEAFVPASVLLQRLHDEAPADHFTLGWLMSRMHKRSFGLIMLLLAVVAIAPGVSTLNRNYSIGRIQHVGAQASIS